MDITLSEFLLFAHITFVAVWLGGDALMQVLALRARAAGPEPTAAFMSDVEWVGARVLTPASLLVVIFGLWLVLEEEAWEFSEFWVSAGMAVFIASFLAGVTFLGPESGRIGKLTEARGAGDIEVQNRIRRVLTVSRIELLLLVLVVLDMVVKPGL
jgi:uncharacterized membrane protein